MELLSAETGDIGPRLTDQWNTVCSLQVHSVLVQWTPFERPFIQQFPLGFLEYKPVSRSSLPGLFPDSPFKFSPSRTLQYISPL